MLTLHIVSTKTFCLAFHGQTIHHPVSSAFPTLFLKKKTQGKEAMINLNHGWIKHTWQRAKNTSCTTFSFFFSFSILFFASFFHFFQMLLLSWHLFVPADHSEAGGLHNDNVLTGRQVENNTLLHVGWDGIVGCLT